MIQLARVYAHLSDFLERTKRRRRKLNEQINQSFVNDDGEQIGEKQADEDKENVNTEVQNAF